jgi:hypothetical protein
MTSNKRAPACPGVGRKVAPSGPRAGVAREVICPECRRLAQIDADGRLLKHAANPPRA